MSYIVPIIYAGNHKVSLVFLPILDAVFLKKILLLKHKTRCLQSMTLMDMLSVSETSR